MLSSLAWVYGKVADLRNTLYDRGVLETFDLGAYTISIGNITTGGTGKTPLVALVAHILAKRGEKVCILTRGYGRTQPRERVLVSDAEKILADPEEAGDEPYELALKLLGKAIVIADADRVSAAQWAKRKFGVNAFILDDGFQHRRVRRDVDIVCIDATNPFGAGKMLPAGRLREPVNNLSRADIVVITRSNLVENLDKIKSEISNLRSGTPVIVSETRIAGVVELGEFHATPQATQSKERSEKALAFCGLGNPKNFYSQLRLEGFTVSANKSFPDHHSYTQNDIFEIEKLAAESSAALLLTTAKDAVKLSNLKFEIPCRVVEIEMVLDKPEEFAAMI